MMQVFCSEEPKKNLGIEFFFYNDYCSVLIIMPYSTKLYNFDILAAPTERSTGGARSE